MKRFKNWKTDVKPFLMPSTNSRPWENLSPFWSNELTMWFMIHFRRMILIVVCCIGKNWFRDKRSNRNVARSKKKIETELVVYYPEFFPKNGNKEQTALRVRRVNLILDSIINQQIEEDQIFNVEKEILETDKPNVWNVWKKGNMERVLEVEFHKFAISVVEKSKQPLDTLTTFTFYATVEHLKEVYKPKKGH